MSEIDPEIPGQPRKAPSPRPLGPRRFIPPKFPSAPPAQAEKAPVIAPLSSAVTAYQRTPYRKPRRQFKIPQAPPWLAKTAWPAFLVIAFIYTLGAFPPWRAAIDNSPLDQSWPMALNWAFTHHFAFGSDFIFTYGPWGFIIGLGYDPATYGLFAAGWMLFAIAYFCGALAIARYVTPHRFISALWLTLLLIIPTPDIPEVLDVRMLAMSWILLALCLFVDKRPVSLVKTLLVVAMALTGQIKFSMTVMAVGALLLISFEQLLRRRIPWLILVFIGTYIMLWLGAHQRLSDLPAFFRNSMSVAGGYAEGQGTNLPTDVGDVTWFLGFAIVLPILAIVAHWRKWVSGALAAAAMLGCLFMAFKAGYIRHDQHERTATTGLALLAVIWTCLLWRSLHWSLRIAAGITICGGVGLAWHSYDRFASPISGPQAAWETISEFPHRTSAVLSWMAGRCNMETDRQRTYSFLRNYPGIPDIQGTVDIYPYNQGLLFARNLDYRPRPVMQSYVAFTPQLEELNAAFLRSDRAAHSILFDIAPIDARFPAMEEAVSWPELLTRYDLKNASGPYLLLERSPRPRQFQIRPAPAEYAHFHEEIKVPGDRMVWAKIDVKSTALGKIMESLYKPPLMVLEVHLQNGTRQQFRLLPAIARHGFVLSPAVTDRVQFALLESSQWRQDMKDWTVTSISVYPATKSGTTHCYASEFSYSFSTLEFPGQDISAVPGVKEYLGFFSILRQLKIAAAEAPLQLIPGPDSHMALFAGGASKLLFPIQPSSARLHVGFGMFDQSFSGDVRTEGVTFRVYGVTSTGQATLIWSRFINPSIQLQDRGPQSAEVSIPSGDFTMIFLETEPLRSHAACYSYWSQLYFH